MVFCITGLSLQFQPWLGTFLISLSICVFHDVHELVVPSLSALITAHWTVILVFQAHSSAPGTSSWPHESLQIFNLLSQLQILTVLTRCHNPFPVFYLNVTNFPTSLVETSRSIDPFLRQRFSITIELQITIILSFIPVVAADWASKLFFLFLSSFTYPSSHSHVPYDAQYSLCRYFFFVVLVLCTYDSVLVTALAPS